MASLARDEEEDDDDDIISVVIGNDLKTEETKGQPMFWLIVMLIFATKCNNIHF